jgi:hypothetical protein
MKYSSNCSAAPWSLSLSTTYPHAHSPHHVYFFVFYFTPFQKNISSWICLVYNSFFLLPFADLIWWIGARWRIAASATGWNPPLTLWNASTAWHDFSIPKVSSYHTHTQTDLLPGKKKAMGEKRKPFREKICFQKNKRKKNAEFVITWELVV